LKIRRRFASGGAITRLLDFLKSRFLPAPPDDDAADALQKVAHDKEALVGQIAERDQKITRLQREITDKTERLGRLAKEMGELKAKGLGKIFR